MKRNEAILFFAELLFLKWGKRGCMLDLLELCFGTKSPAVQGLTLDVYEMIIGTKDITPDIREHGQNFILSLSDETGVSYNGIEAIIIAWTTDNPSTWGSVKGIINMDLISKIQAVLTDKEFARLMCYINMKTIKALL